VSTVAKPLPMAPSGCELDESQLGEQLNRYRRLSSSVLRVERDGPRAHVAFDARVDTTLLAHALTVERGCCSFFTLAYDPSARVLTIHTADDHVDGLMALLTALSPTAISTGRDIA